MLSKESTVAFFATVQQEDERLVERNIEAMGMRKYPPLWQSLLK